jgi:hypothetical protein
MLGVSMAAARAAATAANLPLYAHLGGPGDEHLEWWQAGRKQRGFPGVHGHAAGCPAVCEALRNGAEAFLALNK